MYNNYNDIPYILKPSVAAQTNYETIFAGQASTNGSTITNSDASGAFTVLSQIDGVRIRTLETNTDPTGFANTITDISQYPLGYNHNNSPPECTSTQTTTPSPNYEYRLQYECFKTLPAGQYYANVAASSFDGFMANAILTVEKPIILSGYILEVGGNRIKKITNYDIYNNISNQKVYEYPLDNSNMINNAKLRDIPQFLSKVGRNVKRPEDNFCSVCVDPNVYTLHSTNIIPSPGFHIEYPYVIEKSGISSENGQIDHSFSLATSIGGYQNPPYADPSFLSWQGGLPLKKSTFKKGSNTSLSLLQENTQAFQGESFSNWSAFDQNLKVGIKFLELCNTGYPSLQFPSSDGEGWAAINNSFEIEFVPVYTEGFVHTTKQEKTFQSGTNNSIIRVNNSLYGGANKLLSSETNTADSKQRPLRQIIKYPQDYLIPNSSTNDDFTKGIQILLQNNMVNVPIETYSVGKDQFGNDMLLSATLNQINHLKPVVDKTHNILLQTPIPLSQFTPSFVSSSGTFIKDNRYRLESSYTKYSNENNIIEYKKIDNGLFNSIVWDYKSTLPVAEITGALYDQVAATSFESDGTGNFAISSSGRETSIAVTGTKSYNLGNGGISKTNLDVGKTYIVSYWSNNGVQSVSGTTVSRSGRSYKNFIYYEHEVSSTSTISINGSGLIDELRLYPKNSLMSTRTYNPLIGLTSECDINNKITYYEYDGMNRLSLVRDQENNILKKICYNYTGQPEECATANLPPSSCVPITYSVHSSAGGFTATYTRASTGQTYSFLVPVGSGTLGCIPEGIYTLQITKDGNNLTWFFDVGCRAVSGTSAYFGKLSVSSSTCNSLNIGFELY